MLTPGDRIIVRYRHMDGEYEATVLQPEVDGQVWIEVIEANGKHGACQINTYRVTSPDLGQNRIKFPVGVDSGRMRE